MSKTTQITIAEGLELQQELNSLLGEEIKFSTKYQVQTIINSFKEGIKTFQETRQKIYEKYGEIDKEKERYDFTDANKKLADKELIELISEQITVTGDLKLKDLAELKSKTRYSVVLSIVKK